MPRPLGDHIRGCQRCQRRGICRVLRRVGFLTAAARAQAARHNRLVAQQSDALDTEGRRLLNRRIVVTASFLRRSNAETLSWYRQLRELVALHERCFDPQLSLDPTT